MDHFEVFEHDADNQPFASFFFTDINFSQTSPPNHKLKDGYPVERFTVHPPHEFTCVVCLCVVRNPLECRSCGTLLCEKCVERYKEVRRQQGSRLSPHSDFCCPACREHSDPRTPSKVLLSIILELEVYCKHRASGCQVKRQLREMKTHEKSCAFKVIRCSYCGSLGQKEDFRVSEDESSRKYSCSEACQRTLAFQKLVSENRREEAIKMYYELLKGKDAAN